MRQLSAPASSAAQLCSSSVPVVTNIKGMLLSKGFLRIRLHRSSPLPSGKVEAININEGLRSCNFSKSAMVENTRTEYPACSKYRCASRPDSKSPSTTKIGSAISIALWPLNKQKFKSHEWRYKSRQTVHSSSFS